MIERILFTSAVNFEAARRVTLLPEGHRSRRLHGHSFLAKIRTTVPTALSLFPGAEVSELRKLLSHSVLPLDYQSLNDRITQPTDENLARWLRDHLGLPGMEMVGIQSTRHEGVDLNRTDHAHVWRRYVFDSAHQLPNVPKGHKCGRMHGHGFEVILHADQDLGQGDISIDYDHLDALWDPIFSELHCCCLNDIPGLENPTSEMISSWIWQQLKPNLPELSWVTVFETASCGAHFDGENYRIWKELSLDSAVRLVRAPQNDVRRRIHGHTFTLRLHLSAPLDQVMGWTLDFGDVKAAFNPVFALLDHQPLYELNGLDDGDCASIVRWIKSQITDTLPQLDRIDLYESPGCGVILSWGNQEPALPV
ncbi:MAG: 6-carboxytetrahydropterin synthase [Magnetococcales bacterium]|nr:6-carboxytetrahydropterin synthase [Magnetococcales bacterium]MBF0115780.1 6-carboxytetrahydropterin synthase [Magnetococcales bacterium]